jgi:rhodanese-related sulfurtransferase
MFTDDARSRRTVIFSLATLAVLVVILVAVFRSSPDSISVGEARELFARDSSVVILDVRRPEEYAGETGHLEKAILIPVEELDRRMDELSGIKSRTIVVYCRSGRRSRNATHLLRREGFRALNLEGGITEWRNKEYPVQGEGVK